MAGEFIANGRIRTGTSCFMQAARHTGEAATAASRSSTKRIGDISTHPPTPAPHSVCISRVNDSYGRYIPKNMG